MDETVYCPRCEDPAEAHCDHCPIYVCRACGMQGRPSPTYPDLWNWVHKSELSRPW